MLNPAPSHNEAEFKVEELFFSTTDLNGKITNGNEVFSRISGYTTSELIGKPHSIIRHPDTPRVVFRMLWDSIAQGAPIAAYVKNRSKDGGYYWVLSFVTCIPGGYLSIRFKPTSSYLALVQDLYRLLRAAEIEIESSPGGTKEQAIATSQSLLNAALKEHGFHDYRSFSEEVLYAEFCSRRKLIAGIKSSTSSGATIEIQNALNRISRDLLAILDRDADFLAMENEVRRTTGFIAALPLQVKRASLNITVRSSQNSDSGNALSTVANWLQVGADQVGTELDRLIQPIADELRSLKTGLFNVATSQLQVEMIQYFIEESKRLGPSERGYSDTDARALMKLLAENAYRTFTTSQKSLNRLRGSIESLGFSFSNLQREVTGLSLAHINGEIECARMEDSESIELTLLEAINYIRQARENIGVLGSSFRTLIDLLSSFSKRTVAISKEYARLKSESVWQ